MSRIYMVKGVEYVSVTTVLDCLPKPWLAPWTARTVAEAAADEIDWITMDRDDQVRYLKRAPERLKDAASDRGTHVHAAAVSGDWSACPEYEAAHDNFLRDFGPTLIYQEGVVKNSLYRYAGRFDFVAHFPDLGRGMVDIKTAAGVRDTAQLQLAAYREAAPWALDFGAVLLLHPGGEYVFEPVPCGYEEFLAFAGLLDVYRWLRRTGQLGEPREVVEL